MDRVKSVIHLARSRVRLCRALDAASIALIAVAVVLFLLVAAVKLVPGVSVSAGIVFGAAAAVGALAFIAVMAVRRREAPTDAQIALLVDERLRLDERLTSALAFASSTDAYARAAIADAVAVASDKGIPAKVRAAFPVRVPMRGIASVLGVALLACVQQFVPAYAWPEEEKTPAEAAQVAQKKESAEALERVKEQLESSKALPQDVRDTLSKLANNADPKVGGEAVDEDARREAIRRMSELTNRLDEVKKSDQAQRNEALKRDLATLEKQDGELSKVGEDLAKGDFAGAKQRLEELAKKLESGDMTAAEKAAAADALEKMSKSLDAIADRQQALRDELAKAGLDAQLANNPEALQNAIKDNPNLSEQQREQLQSAAKAAKASQDALRKMADSTKKAASEQRKRNEQQKKQEGQKQGQQGQQPGQRQGQQDQGQKQDPQQGGKDGSGKDGAEQGDTPGVSSPLGQMGEKPGGDQGGEQNSGGKQGGSPGENPDAQPGGSGGSMSDLSQSLSELEVTQQMIEEAEALANMAQSESESLGQGMSKGGNDPGQGQGQGSMMSPNAQRSGMGRGEGGNVGKAKTPTGTKTQKAQSKNAGGDIIARQLIENPNPEVAASVMPQESIESAAAGGSGMAVGEDNVPAHLKEAHKHYFGTLKKELSKKGAAPAKSPAQGSPAAPPTPPAGK